jgi:hypothetical protein
MICDSLTDAQDIEDFFDDLTDKKAPEVWDNGALLVAAVQNNRKDIIEQVADFMKLRFGSESFWIN